MKLAAKIAFLSAIAIVALFPSCIDEESFPVEPHIEYVGFGIYRMEDPDQPGDTLSIAGLTISYTDGDGDLGFYGGEEPDKQNYFLDLYQMNKGHLEVVKDDSAKPIQFNGRMPIFSQGKKSIKGQIFLMMNFSLAKLALTNDTIAFSGYIVDRAEHQSNTVNTPLLIIDRNSLK